MIGSLIWKSEHTFSKKDRWGSNITLRLVKTVYGGDVVRAAS